MAGSGWRPLVRVAGEGSHASSIDRKSWLSIALVLVLVLKNANAPKCQSWFMYIIQALIH